MPAAKTKADLIAVTDKEWAKLTALLDKVTEDEALHDMGEDGTIKDLLAHRAHWIGLFFQWMDEAAAGSEAAMPDHGVKWNQLKAYNAGLRATYAPMTWPEVRDRLQDKHAKLRRYMDGASDEDLYGAPMPGGGSGWTPGRYAEAAGPSHYRSAAKYIRAVRRAIAG